MAIILFTLGGLYALYESYQKITHPHQLTSPLVAVVVLVIAMALEGYALRTAVGEANRTRGSRDWLAFVRRTRSPELPVILLEDTGALIGLVLALLGVGLSVLTGNGVYDGIATGCIGLLLVASRSSWPPRSTACSSARPRCRNRSTAIHTALLSTPGVDRVIHLRTMHLGPEELLVAAKIAVPTTTTTRHRRDHRRRRSSPARGAADRKVVYLEPDIDRGDPAEPGGRLPQGANTDHRHDRP